MPMLYRSLLVIESMTKQSCCAQVRPNWTFSWLAVLSTLPLSHESHVWPLTLAEAIGLQVFASSSVIFCNIINELSLQINVCRVATLGRTHHCSKYSPFGDNGCAYGLVEPQRLRNGFVTLSRLIQQVFFLTSCGISFDHGMVCL